MNWSREGLETPRQKISNTFVFAEKRKMMGIAEAFSLRVAMVKGFSAATLLSEQQQSEMRWQYGLNTNFDHRNLNSPPCCISSQKEGTLRIYARARHVT